jgi:O-antigen ligase
MPFRIVVVVIAEVAAAIGAAIFPYLGLLALLFMTFGRPQDDRPNVEALHIPLVLVISIILGTLIRSRSSIPEFWAGAKRLWIMLVLYALIALSAFANYTPLSRSRLDEFTAVVCLCLLTLGLVTTEKRLRGYLYMLLASGAYVILEALRNPGKIIEQIGNTTFERLAIGKGVTIFGQTNYLALLMVLLIFLSVTLMAFYRSVWQRTVLLALAGSAGYIFFRAQSRGASLALAAGALFLWLIQKRKLKTAIIAVILIGLGVQLAPQSYWDRLATVTRYEQDASATKRLELWDIALQLIAEHPLLGVGPDNFLLYAPNSPHDAYLQIGCEVGIPAMLVYIALLLAGLHSAWRARQLSSPDRQARPYLHAAAQGILCCQLAIVVQGFTTGLAHREFVYVFVMLGICVRRIAEKAEAQSQELEEPASEPVSLEPVES